MQKLSAWSTLGACCPIDFAFSVGKIGSTQQRGLLGQNQVHGKRLRDGNGRGDSEAVRFLPRYSGRSRHVRLRWAGEAYSTLLHRLRESLCLPSKTTCP